MARTPILVCLAGIAAWALASPAPAGDVAGALARVAARAGLAGYAVELRLTADPAQTAALSARYFPGVCRIVALEPSAYIDDALGELDPVDRPVFLEALLAHEIAHCEERHAGGGHPDSSPAPALARVAAARTAEGKVVLKPIDRVELWGEILADAFMVHYLHRWHPAQAAGIAAAQFDRRTRDALADPAHETATALRGADFTVNTGETLLQAARRTRAIATGERRALR